MDHVSMLWLSIDRPIVSQGHQVRVTVGSDAAVSVVGTLNFSVLDRDGETIFTFQDTGFPQGKHMAAVFPVPHTLSNGLYSLHVDVPALNEQASLDISILDDGAVARRERFFEAAGNAAIRGSEDAFEEMDRASLQVLAETYSETHNWEASAAVWGFLAYQVLTDDLELARFYCSCAAEDYLSIELKRQSSRTYFRDLNLTILAHVLASGPLQEEVTNLIESTTDNDPVNNALLFIGILLSFGMTESDLTNSLSHKLGGRVEPQNLFQALLMKWPQLCSIDVDREGAAREPWSFQAAHSQIRSFPPDVLQHHIQSSDFEDALELVEA